MIKDIWFKAEEIVSKVDVADVVIKLFKTVIMFIACIGVFLVLLTATLFKGRKELSIIETVQRISCEILLVSKDRKTLPFNFTLHKVMMSDEPILHSHPW